MKIIRTDTLITFSVIILAAGISLAAQQQPNLQQTPFGVREVPGAAGTQQPPAAPPQVAPATQPPQPTPATPAAAQPAPAQQQPPAPATTPAADDASNISLTMDNADIY